MQPNIREKPLSGNCFYNNNFFISTLSLGLCTYKIKALPEISHQGNVNDIITEGGFPIIHHLLLAVSFILCWHSIELHIKFRQFSISKSMLSE